MAEPSSVALDVNGFFAHMAGSHGLEASDVEGLAPRAEAVLADLAGLRGQGKLPFYELPYDEPGRRRVAEIAADLQQRFDAMVVLGIGGSALGAKAVLDAVAPSRRCAGGIEVVVLDNVDPSTIAETLARLDPGRTAFNVISKSGGTAETMAQLLLVRDFLVRRVGPEALRNSLVVTTDAERGPLREMVAAEGLVSLPVPDGVGGRFSVLSAVGLLPMAVAGIDIDRLCAGARLADRRCAAAGLWENPAALHAALLYLAFTEHRVNIHVLMPYSDRLLRLAEWYGQLWAESIGKRCALDGSVVETGQTPVRALGATDQHSQVQLYVEGPRDKVVTFIRVAEHEGDLAIPEAGESAAGWSRAASYLSGHSLGELLNMEQTATELALAEAGRLTSLLELRSVDEAALGQLFVMLEVQTLVMGGLLGINALDQPGVEAGKRLTYAMAGREGFEDLREQVRKRLADKRDNLVLR